MTMIAPHYSKANKLSRFNFFRNDHFLIKTPWWLKKLYPGCLWKMNSKEKILYLSFDDGPHPTITPFVLDLLKKYNAKASFFCIGENVTKHPETVKRVLEEGHSIGNHTENHLNGWKTSDTDYLENVLKAKTNIPSTLFRPPYGRMKKSQIKLMRQEIVGIKIVMWNILAGDWVETISPEKCFDRIRNKISNGDIIVLHDSEKAFPRMQYVLPQILQHFSEKGFLFKALPY